MICPKCQHSRVRLLRTMRPRRRYECLSKACSHRWWTREVEEDEGVAVDAKVRRALRFIEEAVEEVRDRYGR